MALGNGAALVLTSQDTLASGPDLLRLLQEQRVTTVTLPPSLLSVLTPSTTGADSLPALETVIAAGERCANEIVRQWTRSPERSERPQSGQSGVEGRRFFNAYGPTETTVCAAMHRCDPGAEWPFGGPPIGKPLPTSSFTSSTKTCSRSPSAFPASCSAGGRPSRGYLNRPELTAERFVRQRNSD